LESTQSTQRGQSQAGEAAAPPAGEAAITNDNTKAEQSQVLDALVTTAPPPIVTADPAEPVGASQGQGSHARRAWQYDLYLAGLIVLAFAADQTSKGWIRSNLLLGESLPTAGFFRLLHTYNTGSAFGLFPGQTFLLMLASLVGIGILLLYFKNETIPPFWLRTSLGLQLGGAAGNLVDRITLGRVTDFIAVGPWPVFNLADSSIMVGIAILAWFVWRTPKEQTKRQKADALPSQAPLAGEQTTPVDTNAVPTAAGIGTPIESNLAVAALAGDAPQSPTDEAHARNV